MILTLFAASTASAMELPQTAYGSIARNQEIVVTEQVPALTAVNTESLVRSYFKDTPIMVEIARCESKFQHELADGTIIQGAVDPADTGVMQINKRYHESAATAMHLDLDDVYENLAYARHLFETQGTRPWNASRACWGNTLAMNY